MIGVVFIVTTVGQLGRAVLLPTTAVPVVPDITPGLGCRAATKRRGNVTPCDLADAAPCQAAAWLLLFAVVGT